MTTKKERSDDSICAVCDGGPGNSCACACGLKRWEHATVPLTGELVEDVLDETMFVKHQTESTLYHELVRAHERMGGTIFKEAADTIRAQRKQIFALEGRDAVDASKGDAHWDACPTARGALASSIDGVEALSFSEDRGLTVSETESMMLVLHELRRLQVVERQAVEIVAGASKAQAPIALTDADICSVTMDKLGKWPSFLAQSWACKVVHAVLAAPVADAQASSTNLGEEAMQRAAGDLPVGYAMRICLENGAGWVEIDDAEGNELTLETDTEGMTNRINESIDIAVAHAAANSGAKHE